MKRALAVAGAAGFAYYHAQVPTSQLYGATICREPGAGRAIALTYDDGPNPAHTPDLLRILERHDAQATFFSIGRWAEREPGLLREVRSAGHAGRQSHVRPPDAGALLDRAREGRAAPLPRGRRGGRRAVR